MSDGRKDFELPPWVSLAGIVAPVLWLVFPKWPPQVLAALVVLACLGLAELFLRLRRLARNVFPPDAGAWTILLSLLTGRLPVSKGVEKPEQHGGVVLAIATAVAQKRLEPIKKRYNQVREYVAEFLIGADEASLDREHLESALASAIGVYVIRTHDMESHRWLVQQLEQWAFANTHKPVVVVNCAPKIAYDWPFISIPESSATEGVWQLLVRATERGLGWRALAGVTRAALLLAVLVLAAFVIAERREAHALHRQVSSAYGEIESRNARYKISINNHVQQLVPAYAGLAQGLDDAVAIHGSEAINKLREDFLSKYSSYLKSELIMRAKITQQDEGYVTFWRRLSNENGREMVAQIGRSTTPEKFGYWNVDMNSFVGAAFRRECFVLWDSGAHPGDPAAWNLAGDTLAWVLGPDRIGFGKSREEAMRGGDVGAFGSGKPTQRRGYIVLAIGGPDGVACGISVDLPNNQEVLREPWLRQFLVDALAVAFVFPERCFSSKGLVPLANGTP